MKPGENIWYRDQGTTKRKLIKLIKNISGRIRSSRLFNGNSSAVDAILILLFISFFVVGADLTKELAKGEFVFFACILTETQTVDTFVIFDSLFYNPPVIGVIAELNFIPPKSDVSELYRGRDPPALPLYL